MPAIASHPTEPSQRPKDAGFSLVELIAGLLVAALLVVGLGDIIRRYARTTETVRSSVAELRSEGLIGAVFQELERADPGSLSVSPVRLAAQIGNTSFSIVVSSQADRSKVDLNTPRQNRQILLSEQVHFEKRSSGLVLLLAEDNSVIATARLRRDLPFDCRFELALGTCRE